MYKKDGLHKAKIFYTDGSVEDVFFNSITFDPEYPFEIHVSMEGAGCVLDIRKISRIDFGSLTLLPRTQEEL